MAHCIAALLYRRVFHLEERLARPFAGDDPPAILDHQGAAFDLFHPGGKDRQHAAVDGARDVGRDDIAPMLLEDLGGPAGQPHWRWRPALDDGDKVLRSAAFLQRAVQFLALA